MRHGADFGAHDGGGDQHQIKRPHEDISGRFSAESHEPREVRQVISPIETRLFAAHFVHADRTSPTPQAIFRLPQAAGPSFPLLSFWPKARRNKAPETKERRGSRTLLSVCAKTALACPPAAPDQQQMQGRAAGAGGAAVKERQQGEGEAGGRRPQEASSG